MRLSFASFTLQPPLQQTSPSPWPPAFPLPLHPPEEERGLIKRYTRDFRILSVRSTVVQLPLLDLRFASVDKGSDTYQTAYRDAI